MNDITQGQVIKYLEEKGYEIDKKMYKHINGWYQWFQGKVKEFHEYMHYNGLDYDTKQRYSLGLPKKFAESWADLLFNEKVWINIAEEDQEKLNKMLNENNFRKQANQLIEKSFALGTGSFVEYKNFLSKPKINYLVAPMIFPLRSENGEVVDCAFGSYKGKNTFYVQIHEKQQNDTYKIQNVYFTYEPKTSEIKETSIDKLKTFIKPIDVSPIPLFQILTPNITNNINMFSSLGISVYANALDEIKTTDIIFDSFKNEFETGRKRVYVKTGAVNVKINEEGQTVPIFDKNQTEFFAIPGDPEDGDVVKEAQSELRATSLIDGLDTAINLAGDKAGFGPDYFSFKDGQVYTNTTQVISSNSKLYRTMKKHQLVLESALIGLVKALWYLETGKTYNKDITIDFDDSIIEDMAEIRRQAMLEYNSGLIDEIEYYQRVDKLSEDQAEKYYKKIQDRKPKVETEEELEQ